MKNKAKSRKLIPRRLINIYIVQYGCYKCKTEKRILCLKYSESVINKIKYGFVLCEDCLIKAKEKMESKKIPRGKEWKWHLIHDLLSIYQEKRNDTSKFVVKRLQKHKRDRLTV